MTGANAPPRAASFATSLVPAGVVTILIGTIGDLFSHALQPAAHAHEELIVLGAGNNPWHLVLFAGILLTAVAGIVWAASLPSEFGSLLAATMVILLAATVALGGWSGWQARHESHEAGGQSPAASAGTVSSAHQHLPSTETDGGQQTAEGASLFGGHSHEPGPVSAEQSLLLKQQLAGAKTATARYRRISAARADGYFQVTQFIPGLGLHMVNLSIPTTTFDPSRPQILLYEPDGRGRMTLVGVAYMQAHTNEVPPDGFAGGSDVWHYHNNLCFLPDGTVTIAPSASACRSKRGLFQQQTDWLLHAWLWRANPNGVFTEYNPVVF